MMLLIDFPLWMRILLGLLGSALVFSCLCRAKHMTHRTTVTPIRYATTALAGAGFVLVLSVILRPDWVMGSLLSLAASALAVQAVSASYWRRGLPPQFTKTRELDLHALRSVSGGRGEP